MPDTSGGKFTNPNYATQTGTAFPVGLANGLMNVKRIGNNFNCYAQSTPNMTVSIDAGHIFNGAALTEVVAQTSGIFTAPVSNPRIDRVVIDRVTGTMSVVAGTEAVSPTPPAIPAGKQPVAQIALTVGMVAIGNTSITDERDLGALGIPATNLNVVSTGQSIGAGQNGQAFLATAALTATIAQTTTLHPYWTAYFFAYGGAITVTPNAADAINGGSAGASVVIPAGSTGEMSTDASGKLYLETAQAFVGSGSVASASSCDIGSVPNPLISVTGTIGVNDFGKSLQAGQTKVITFAAALALGNNSNIIIQGKTGAVTTAAGDMAMVTCITSGAQPSTPAICRVVYFSLAAAAASAITPPVRQTVLNGASTSGAPSFLQINGDNVNLLATATPVEIAFANGFGANGAKDDIYQFTADQTSFWASLPNNSTLFLYVDYNSGSPTGGYSTLVPVDGPTAPGTPSTDQHWFDTVNYQMKRWSGSAWVVVERVFVGEAVTYSAQVVAHTGNAGGTTSAINTTGANLIVVGVHDVGTNPSSISDSASNTWTLAKAQLGTSVGVALYYCYNPTTSASHTFSESGASDPSMFVIAFSGAVSSPLDQTNSGTSSATTVQTGSVTPSQNNEILAVIGANGSGGSVTLNSIDSGFTITDKVPGAGANASGGIAYLFQSTAASVNPTLTFSTSNGNAAAIATFKTGGPAVQTVTTYAYQGCYVGPWTATLPSSGTLASANDNLGTQTKTAIFEIQNITTEKGYSVGDVVPNPTVASGVPLQPNLRRNSVGVMSGGFYLPDFNDTTVSAPAAAKWQSRWRVTRGY